MRDVLSSKMNSFRVSIFSLVLLPVVVSLGCMAKERSPCKYLIPGGYVGWIRIDYKIEGAPALSVEGVHRLIKIPPNGHLETSSDIEYGTAADEYYYYSDKSLLPLAVANWDGGGMVWAHSNGSGHDSENKETAVYEHFFVGTEDEYKKHGADYGDHKIGPVSKPSPH